MIPEATKEIGGVIYSIRFSARTTIAIEQEFGCKIRDLPAIIGTEPDVTTTAKLAKLCIRKDGKMLTDAEFDGVLDQITVEELGDLLTDAMRTSAPTGRGGDTGNRNRSTGGCTSTSTSPQAQDTSTTHASSTT